MYQDKLDRVPIAISSIESAYSSEMWWDSSMETRLVGIQAIYGAIGALLLEVTGKIANSASSNTLHTDVILKIGIMNVPTDLTEAFEYKYVVGNNSYIGNFIESTVVHLESMASAGYTTAEQMNSALSIQEGYLATRSSEVDALKTENDYFDSLISDVNSSIASSSTLAPTEDELILALDASDNPLLTDKNPVFADSLAQVVPLLGTPPEDKFNALLALVNTNTNADARALTSKTNLLALTSIFV